jgi:hypothetical protein
MSAIRIIGDSCYAARCRSCGAAIVWATTPTGSKIPLDTTPIPIARELDLFTSCELWTVDLSQASSHFATCPDAARWRASR